jgi:CBS domain-containing membrane protein
VIDNPVDPAPLAVAFSIAAMIALRCVHPPSDAVALTAVLGGPAVHALGFDSCLCPLHFSRLHCSWLQLRFIRGRDIGIRIACMRGVVNIARTPAPDGVPSFTREVLKMVLGRRNELLDVDPNDLDALLHELQVQFYVRTFIGMNCNEIMSANVISLPPTTPVRKAAALLRRHSIKALPIFDENTRMIGIVTRANIARSGRDESWWLSIALFARWLKGNLSEPTVATIMTRNVSTANTTTSITELVPIFTAFGHHHIPVLDNDGRLAGMIAQADLIRALYRQSHSGKSAIY